MLLPQVGTALTTLWESEMHGLVLLGYKNTKLFVERLEKDTDKDKDADAGRDRTEETR